MAVKIVSIVDEGLGHSSDVLDLGDGAAAVVRQCLGIERLLGELDGGFDAWTASGRPLATIRVVAPGDRARRPGQLKPPWRCRSAIWPCGR